MNGISRFKNRQEAGEMLAKSLQSYKGQNVVVYALPRGGVVIGAAVTKSLNLPLDLILARKIGHPYNPEFAIGAISENGHLIGEILIPDRVDPEWLKGEIERKQAEIRRRRELYLQGREPISAKDKTAIIVDDGLATGSTMLAAIEDIYHQKPEKIVVAVPVSPPDTAELIRPKVDEFIALIIDPFFGAVGSYYDEFEQVSDEEVIQIMNSSRS